MLFRSKKAGVTFIFSEKVKEINVLQGSMRGIITEKREYPCDCAIVCTGGMSYPATGSAGDGYRFARDCGHKIVTPVPSLVGIDLKGDWKDVQGISLKNAVLTAEHNGKTISSRLGELLFTHFGISGPLALSLSAEINRIDLKEVDLFLDFKPALDEAKLDARLVRDFSERKNEQLKNVMRGLLPAKLVFPVLSAAQVLPEKQANAVTKGERARLVETLKKFSLKPVSLRGFSEAVVTAGGVDLKEINPKTMESKLVKGLYFCGETLDIDAYTGGFNLQLAFSTGFAAGNSIV